MVDYARGENNANINVCDLFKPDDRKWDIHKVSNSFQSCNAKAILVTPIPKK